MTAAESQKISGYRYRRPAPEVPDVTPETEVATVAVSIPAGAAV